MTEQEAREADLAIARSLEGKLCSDCPPVGHIVKTRCIPCPRHVCAYGDNCPILGGPRHGCTYCGNAPRKSAPAERTPKDDR
jgi:hypothetical protein